ncbi:MAG: AAA family ATPase, partial [Planctomycetota bacterium]
MKLNEIYVDGFGTWNHLRLGDLSPSLTVFYGPNEAGKTTLMHFLRSVLYGVTPERRERYLPPRHGGEPGGSLGLVTDEAYFTAARYVERGADDRGRVTVTLPNGEEQGDRLLREALESVDEATYCNVFAIGLDEINELGALAGAEAARWIYRLTSGLDRVSLYDVIRGLRDERSALLAPSGERSRLGELISHRDTLQTEIEELAVGERRWSKLAVAIDEVDAQTEQLRTELRETERKARRIEVALGLKPLWLERASAIEQRARYDGLPKLIDRPIETLDDINARAEEAQRGRERVRGQRRELHQEIEELGVNDALVRCGCRLEALEEQQGWLAALERESAELGEDVQRLDARIETEQTRLAKLWRHKPTPEAAPDLDEATLETLQPAREAVGAAEQMVAEAKRELDAQRGNQQHYDSQVENALTSSEKLNLPTDIQEAGELVSMLRSRLKSEHKTEQARRRVDELDRERLSLIEGQVLPIEVFTLLAAAFAAAVVVVCWPLVTGGSTIGWWPLAFLGAVGCVFLRYLLEDNRATQLDTCQEQIAAAKKHVDDALAEQERLDEDLPLREGSVAMRLQHAEQHLEELERMMPIEAERRKASQRTRTAEAMLRSAKEELTAAEKEWRSTLRSVGLPDETTAAEVEKLAAQYRNLNELRERSEAKRE